MAKLAILEPVSTGDIIDRAVRLYRRNFAQLIKIVAVPSLLGYFASLMFWYGYLGILGGLEPGGTDRLQTVPPDAMAALAIGGVLYPLWLLILLMTIAGLSRSVGDHVMLGEPISFRTCFGAARHRLLDIILMGLLLLVAVVMLYIFLMATTFGVMMIAGISGGVLIAMGFPAWLMLGLISLAAIAGVAIGVAGMLALIAHVAFMPQVVMLEGQSAGAALSRSIKLGRKNWYRVGAIMLFAYFVTISLFAAMAVPLPISHALFGWPARDFFEGVLWSAISAGLNQVAALLVLPIWVLSFTLLYFDSRVRKEAYDIELLARELSPGFEWRPVRNQTPFGYQVPVTLESGRTYVQTSPLGLAGYVPPSSGKSSQVGTPDTISKRCAACDEPLWTDSIVQAEAKFCLRCGAAV